MKRISLAARVEPLLTRMRAAAHIVVTAHARPDGDALGAALALGELLRNQGAAVQVALEPAEIGALAALEGTQTLTPPAGANMAGDLLVLLDCGDLDRMPEALLPLSRRAFTINIDHHATNAMFAALNWVEPVCSSCGQMVWMLARHAGWPLNQRIAEALWVALITDTGRFAYENTKPATLRCAADLLRHGVRTAWLNDQLYGQFDFKVLRLRQRAYDSLELWCEGRVAVASLTREDFAATGCTKAEADDIIEIPRSARGTEVALYLYQATSDQGVTRLSIRTRPPLDATALAQRYGGGGHLRAAGCSLPGDLPEARSALRETIRAWLAE